MNQRPSQIPWFPLAFPAAFVSIAASMAPNMLLGDLDPADHLIALFILASVAIIVIGAALIEDLQG